jgi:uncharacterized membrane protein/uncharacterized membrane protein YbhN (UPF0104 family)
VKDRIYSLLKFLIGWPLSIVAVFFLVKLVTPQAPKFFSQLHEISLPLLFYGIVCFLIYYFLRGYIWKRQIKQAGYELSYKDVNYIWAASELKRYIPGNIWSFIGRSVLLHEKGMTKKDIAKCTLYEIEFLIFGAVAVSLLALPFVVTHFQFPYYLLSITVVGFIASVLLFAYHTKLKIKLFVLPPFPPQEMLFLIFLSTLLFLFFGLGYFFTFISFISLNPNLIWQLTGLSVLSFLVGYLSLLTPSGIGVREGALVVALSKIMSTAAAGFVSLFARFILIVAEIIFVLLSYLWSMTKNKKIHLIEKWIGKHQQVVVVSVLTTIYTIYFTTVSFLRFENFYTGKFDLGNMAQTVWNTTQGRFFLFSDPHGTETVSRLSTHADFLLILLAPFYALWPDPRTLLFIQSVVVALGAFFVYLIAKEVLKHKNLALTLAFVYLINPSIQRVNLYEFHAAALATTFLLGAYYFFLKKRFGFFLTFAILAGICKEQIWLIISLFGILLIYPYKKYLAGSLLFVTSLALCFFLISYAIPNALGSKHFALAYYSDFGDSPTAIIKSILFSPDKTLGILFQHDRIDYLKQLFYPIGYFSLLAPMFLIFATPDLTINLLSNNGQLHQIYYQYTATISPFLFIAAIYGIWFLRITIERYWKSPAINKLLILYLLGTACYTAYLYGPLPGARDPNTDMITKSVENKTFIEQELVKIPKDASVAASNNIANHLINRQHIFILPVGVEKAEYVIFYLTPFQSAADLEANQKLLNELRKNPQYKIVTEKGIFIILQNMYHGS